MQFLRHLAKAALSQRLARGELALHIGPYVYSIKSNLPMVTAGIATLYGDYVLAEPAEFVDFDIAMVCNSLLRRVRGKSEFLIDESKPFDDIPTGQAYAFLEWGMNWCVSVHSNEYLKLHAAAVSKGDVAVIMPGVPGAGKSTLCAALGLSGWRILSDEHAMIPPNTTGIVPICRPVSLKNESIEAIKSFSSSCTLGPVSKRTHKGVVVHMKADMHPASHDPSPVTARAMIFPRFSRDDKQHISKRRRTDSFILAAYHSFNYSLLGEAGFDAMKTLLDNVECYDLVYQDLDWAVRAINELPEIRFDQ